MHKINIFSYWIKLKTTYTASLHERSLWPDREPKEILKSQRLCKELSSQVTDQTQYCASCKQDNRVWFASMSSGIFLACTPATADQSGGWGRRRYFPNSRDPNVPQQHFDLASRNLLNYLRSSKLTTLQYRPLMWLQSAVPNALNSVESAFKFQL